MRLCGIAKCDLPYFSRDMCRKHYARWWRTGRVDLPNQRTVEQRFFDVVHAANIDECWIWFGDENDKGYGMFALYNRGSRRRTGAHRWCYEFLRAEIPSGLDLDHLCRVTRCVNPWHLEPVTRKVNLNRGVYVSAQSLKTHCPKGHPYDAANTSIDRRGRRCCRTCRRQQSAQARQRQRLKALTKS